jgi:hypothetical protein
MDTPTGSPVGTFNIDFSSRGDDTPRIASHSAESTPRLRRSHCGRDAAMQPLIRKNAPKELMAAQGSPAAPLLPRIRDSDVVPPTRVVAAAIFIRLFPAIVILQSIMLRSFSRWGEGGS